MHIASRPQNFFRDYADKATSGNDPSPGVAHVPVRGPKAIVPPTRLVQLLMLLRIFGLVSLFLVGLGLLIPAYIAKE